MRRLLCVIAMMAGVLLAGTGVASAVEAHYTDGTETYTPNLCNADQTVCTAPDGTGFGPIPYGPVFVNPCEVIEFDPPTIVWVTIHIDYGSDGTVDTYKVVPYERIAPAVVESNIEDLLALHEGELWLTWNFGSGETDHVAFDCIPEEPTTTTTTTVPVTSTTISHDEVQETTTTTAAPMSLATAELPRTGSTTFPLTAVGVLLLAAGIVAARKGRRQHA